MTAHVWPPECCVPAFLHGAMLAKSVAVAEPSALPRILGVRVRPGQDNPFGLALADSHHPPGIRAKDAEAGINRLFADLGLPLRCRRVPFLEIGLGLWEELLDAALAKGIVVGLGLDFNVLTRRSIPSSAEHVLRVLGRSGRHLEVIDDSGEATPALRRVTTEDAAKAVLAIPDGFWMIGAEIDLRLPLTSPWEASQ